MTLFLRYKKDAEENTAFRYASNGGVQGFYWIDGDLGYTLTGEVAKSIISDAAHIVYKEYNL